MVNLSNLLYLFGTSVAFITTVICSLDATTKRELHGSYPLHWSTGSEEERGVWFGGEEHKGERLG